MKVFFKVINPNAKSFLSIRSIVIIAELLEEIYCRRKENLRKILIRKLANNTLI
jgi:hypothetical protein